MMPPVIILAGGLGTRLRDITHNKMPKPMVPISYQGENFPYLLFILSNLYQQGIRKVILCVDHLAEQVVSYFGDGHQYGMQITYDHAGPVLTAARVKHAMVGMDDTEVIIHCGDVFHPLNIEQFLVNFRQHTENLMQIAVHTQSVSDDAAPNLSIDENNQVVGYQTKQSGENRLVVDTGVLLVRKDILSYISDAPDASLTEDLYPTLIDHGTVGAYESGVAFYDVGTPSEYSRFCKYIEQAGIKPLMKQENGTDDLS